MLILYVCEVDEAKSLTYVDMSLLGNEYICP